MTKEERADKWKAEFIPCKNHPERRCNRSTFVWGNRLCASCLVLKRANRTNTRAAKWAAEFISCSKHPNNRCTRSNYVKKGMRQCSQCFNAKPWAKILKKRWKKSEAGRASQSRWRQSEGGQKAKAWYLERKLHG